MPHNMFQNKTTITAYLANGPLRVYSLVWIEKPGCMVKIHIEAESDSPIKTFAEALINLGVPEDCTMTINRHRVGETTIHGITIKQILEDKMG